MKDHLKFIFNAIERTLVIEIAYVRTPSSKLTKTYDRWAWWVNKTRDINDPPDRSHSSADGFDCFA